jgi:hypothetical protein
MSSGWAREAAMDAKVARRVAWVSFCWFDEGKKY